MLQRVSVPGGKKKLNAHAIKHGHTRTYCVLVNKNSSGTRRRRALIHVNCTQGNNVCNASDGVHCRVLNVISFSLSLFFTVSMSSFCEAVLSLVNYTPRYARE